MWCQGRKGGRRRRRGGSQARWCGVSQHHRSISSSRTAECRVEVLRFPFLLQQKMGEGERRRDTKTPCDPRERLQQHRGCLVPSFVSCCCSCRTRDSYREYHSSWTPHQQRQSQQQQHQLCNARAARLLLPPPLLLRECSPPLCCIRPPSAPTFNLPPPPNPKLP